MNTKKQKESKPIQIIMDKAAHAQLKRRAKQLDNKIGDFVENLLTSLELRLDNFYKAAEIETRSEIADIEFMKMIFSIDFGGTNLTKEEFIEHLEFVKEKIRDANVYEEWKPEFKL